jgi:hypothetical protein
MVSMTCLAPEWRYYMTCTLTCHQRCRYKNVAAITVWKKE